MPACLVLGLSIGGRRGKARAEKMLEGGTWRGDQATEWESESWVTNNKREGMLQNFSPNITTCFNP